MMKHKKYVRKKRKNGSHRKISKKYRWMRKHFGPAIRPRKAHKLMIQMRGKMRSAKRNRNPKMTIDDLDPATKRMIPKMKAKGYRYVIQFENFGDPLFFKTEMAVGPFMRDNNLKMKWTLRLD
jgi:hypothetical protein